MGGRHSRLERFIVNIVDVVDAFDDATKLLVAQSFADGRGVRDRSDGELVDKGSGHIVLGVQ